MVRARRSAVALVAALALAVALACGTAAGAETTVVPAASDGISVTQSIFLDYSLDHVINGKYDAPELQAALAAARGQGAPYREFERAVQDVYDREFLGLDTGDGDGATAQPPDDTSTLLPEPRGPGERDQPPWPFLAMTAMGVALVLTGAGSSIYRRVHR